MDRGYYLEGCGVVVAVVWDVVAVVYKMVHCNPLKINFPGPEKKFILSEVAVD